MKANTNYNFKVVHIVDFELFDEKATANSTYDIQFEQLESKNLHIEVRRNDFKVNDKKIESKLEEIAYEYNNSIFPVLFNVEDRAFSISNYSEIAERIKAKDEELKLKHEGPEFEYIRNEFLENAAKDENSITQYFSSLGLMKVVMLCFQEAENQERYHFHWDIIPIEANFSWDGKIKFDSTLKMLILEGYEANNEELFKKIKECAIAYMSPEQLTDLEAPTSASVKNKTQFVNTKLDLEFSETEVKINNPYFNYHETLSINRKY
ncbi:hypothetical protein [uncultured Flavobacterium sp.]|uniref:hypothetical protein n=1 Tax=uncultured Flavobacterium sp. TaxID=165435 RepID=UPI00292D9AA5|nr:hypothetical protein [uncultured Flavobacterium sp.]